MDAMELDTCERIGRSEVCDGSLNWSWIDEAARARSVGSVVAFGPRGDCDTRDASEIPPTVDRLLAIMREVRDAESFEANPHERTCINNERPGGCDCARWTRKRAAWAAFHAALAAAGVPAVSA